MKRALTILAILGLLSIVTVLSVTAAQEPERYTIVFKGKGVPNNAEQTVAAAGGELVATLPEIGVGTAESSDPSFADNLSGAKGIFAVGLELQMELPPLEIEEFSAEAPTATDDLYFAYQWDIRRVGAEQAWDTTSGSHDTVVAVIDTGSASNHPDIAPNLVHAGCYSSGPSCSTYPDLHWHGTHVAGTVAAAFDGGRVVGVGPDLGLASYNVFEIIPGCGICAYDGPIWAAMIDAAERGFDVINMSLGSTIVINEDGPADMIAWNRVVDYVTRQGVTVVASAGNDDESSNGPVTHIPSDVTGVISVAATGIRPDPVFPQDPFWDVRAFYSNYGSAVTLSAPGGDLGPAGTPLPFPGAFYLVMSSFVIVDPACAATASCPVGYAWAGGTSMASPHVAGAAGLVLENNPDLNPHQVTSILKRTAQNLGDRQQFGHGMLDVYAAVNE